MQIIVGNEFCARPATVLWSSSSSLPTPILYVELILQAPAFKEFCAMNQVRFLTLGLIEDALLHAALGSARGNISKAASLLGMTRAQMDYRAEKSMPPLGYQSLASGTTTPVNSDQSGEAAVKPCATPTSMVMRLLGL
jgi:hypothetical protein